MQLGNQHLSKIMLIIYQWSMVTFKGPSHGMPVVAHEGKNHRAVGEKSWWFMKNLEKNIWLVVFRHPSEKD